MQGEPSARHALAAMWGNGGRPLMAISGAFIVVVGLVIGMAVAVFVRPEPPDPLGDYPVQEVAPGRIVVGDPVIVTGTKCADVGVEIEYSSYWVSTVPGGVTIPLKSGRAAKPEGCIEKTFRNIPPVDVTKQQKVWCAEKVRQSTWFITGTERPLPEGNVRVWQTETFEVHCE